MHLFTATLKSTTTKTTSTTTTTVPPTTTHKITKPSTQSHYTKPATTTTNLANALSATSTKIKTTTSTALTIKPTTYNTTSIHLIPIVVTTTRTPNERVSSTTTRPIVSSEDLPTSNDPLAQPSTPVLSGDRDFYSHRLRLKPGFHYPS